MKKNYSFDEIGLIPTTISNINSRKEVNPYIDNKLPIFVAPMTCIINADNFDKFEASRVIPIMPVHKHSKDFSSNCWKALSLDDTISAFEEGILTNDNKILIDTANGHMKRLYDTVRTIKETLPNITIMIGNIANPQTYIECCEAGVDYVRVGIGGGSGCTTSVQTGIHTSLPYLLTEIKKIKIKDKEVCPNRFQTKVIADGGVNTIAKAIKALALGADYVMMGKCFAQCEESCGKIIKMPCGDYEVENLYKKYYGQSSEEGQIDRFGYVKSNPEGTSCLLPITGTLEEFCDKFEAALRSSMSYVGASNLNEFNPEYIILSNQEFKAYNK